MTNDSSSGTRPLPNRADSVHFRGLTNNKPTPHDNQPESTLAAKSDSFWTLPLLEGKCNQKKSETAA